MQAMIFQGGEAVAASNTIEMSEWTPESVTAAFVDYHGEDWAEETTDMYETADGMPMLMTDTIDIVNDRFAQCTTDGYDGGMTYLVRID